MSFIRDFITRNKIATKLASDDNYDRQQVVLHLRAIATRCEQQRQNLDASYRRQEELSALCNAFYEHIQVLRAENQILRSESVWQEVDESYE